MFSLREIESNFYAEAWDYTEYIEIPVFAVTLYLVMVFYIPQKMTTGFNLTIPFAAWNLFLSLFSIIGMFRVTPTLVSALMEKGFIYTICTTPTSWYMVQGTPCALWTYLFVASKFPELLDTAFLVLQKKRVIFLHWFHHVTVLLFSFHAYKKQSAQSIWYVVMNYIVHSVMYLYYAVSILGLGRFARPIAPLITIMQITQMFLGTTVTVVAAYMHANHGKEECDVNPSNIRMGLGMYLSYLILFAMLFYSNYLAPNARHKKGASTLGANASKPIPSSISTSDHALRSSSSSPTIVSPSHASNLGGDRRSSQAGSERQLVEKDEICGVDASSLRDTAGFFHGLRAEGATSPAKKKRN